MTTLRTAAQQALEALEGGADSWQLVGPAIDALKAALVEDAMQKFTDVNQELQAALAEDVATHGSAWSKNGKRIDPMSVYAEPVQEQPVCDECGKHKQDGWALYCVGCVEPMFGLQRPAEPVQEPVCAHGVGKTKCSFCSVEYKQPVQEPVAWMHVPHPSNGMSPMVSMSKHREPSMYAASVPLFLKEQL